MQNNNNKFKKRAIIEFPSWTAMFQGWVGIDFSDWAMFVGLGSAAAASVEVPVISLVPARGRR